MKGNLYKRLLEGINEGISAALTRKPFPDISGEGIDVHVPDDSSAFSKHSRLYYGLRDFVDNRLHEFSESRDLSILTDDDVDWLDGYFRQFPDIPADLGEFPEIPGMFRPRDANGCNALARKFPTLSWTRLLSGQKIGDFLFDISFIDGDGREMEGSNGNFSGNQPRLIHFRTLCAYPSLESSHRMLDMCVPVDWIAYHREMTFNEALIYCNGCHVRLGNGRCMDGHLPDKFEMHALCRFSDVIDRALEIAGSEPLRLSRIGANVWRTSSDSNWEPEKYSVNLKNGVISSEGGFKELHVPCIPVFRESMERK